MFDEPVNGLDPEGMVWIRTRLKGMPDEGRTIFISSHLMTEMAMTPDQLIVVGRGRLIFEPRRPRGEARCSRHQSTPGAGRRIVDARFDSGAR